MTILLHFVNSMILITCLNNPSLKMFLANKAIQDHLLEVEASKDQMEKEMLEKIGKLEKELENANDLLSATKRKGMINRCFLVT